LEWVVLCGANHSGWYTAFQLGSTVNVNVEVRSSEGPVMEGARITDGCNLSKKPSDCFGRTVGQNVLYGILLLSGGLAVLCCPCICFLLCVKGVFGHSVAQQTSQRAQVISPYVPAWAITASQPAAPTGYGQAPPPSAPGNYHNYQSGKVERNGQA